MYSHGSRKLAVIAVGMLFVCLHSVHAADFAGSVQGVVKSASGQALSGAYVKVINPGAASDLHGRQPSAGPLHGQRPSPGAIHCAGDWERLSEQARAGERDSSPACDRGCVPDGPAGAPCPEWLGPYPRPRERQRDGSRVASPGPAGRGRQEACAGQVRPMPLPAPPDANAMDPRQLGEKARLDAGTRPGESCPRRWLDRSGKCDPAGLSVEEFFDHYPQGRSQRPAVQNPAPGRRRQVYRDRL